MKKAVFLILIFILCSCSNSEALDPATESTITKPETLIKVKTETLSEKVRTYTSVNGVVEECVALAKIPGGDYSKSDLKDENKYCEVSFYQEGFALCPKTWSTSPGTMVYDLSDSDFTTSSYESSSSCGSKTKGAGVSTLAKFKQSMNASGTSGTLSQSSLLYYHFSRYFDSKVTVPVSVYRDMDKDIHLSRVSRKGVKRAKGAMNKAGWKHLENAESNPKSYSPTDDLFSPDRKKIYGVMLRGKGERYGSEFNGTRVSGWGKGQSRDFQKTPGFLALRYKGSLVDALEYGAERAAQDSKMRKDLVGINDVQIVFWMRELIEITLMDYIFSQQDRVGNIDYRWYWAYIEQAKVKYAREKRDEYKDLPRRKMNSIPVPEKLTLLKPLLIQRTQINDNDAGARVAYANFTKSTGMLDNLEHYSAKLYKRLMKLDKDLQSNGPVYKWLENSIDLTPKRIKQIVSNTSKAANILRGQCKNLSFDLDDVDKYYVEGPRVESVDCAEF